MSDRQRQQAGRPWGPANPQALNRYSYTLNNPVRWTDPSGHCPMCIVVPWAIGAAEALFDFAMVIIGGYLAYDTVTQLAEVQQKVADRAESRSEEKGSNASEAKQSRKSGSERGSDIPSWAKGKKALPNEKPTDTAKRLMDEQYGKGNWKDGPGSEYNQIKKYYERNKP